MDRRQSTIFLTLVIFLAALASFGIYRLPKPVPIVLTHVKRGVGTSQAKQDGKKYPSLEGGRQPCTAGTSISLENIETFDWSYCALDLSAFWKKLGIPIGPFTDSSSLFEVSSTYGDLDGDNVDERLLHFRVSGNALSRIVVLKRADEEPTGWRSLGYLDLETLHLQPEARIVTNGRERWMAVSHIEKAWGTGIFQENESWYAITDRGLNEVLSFPAEGHITWVSEPVINLRFTATVNIAAAGNTTDQVNLLYTTTLVDFPDSDSIQKTVSFVKARSAFPFMFDPSGSTISQSDFRAMYSFDTEQFDQHFLNVGRETLVGLARSRKSARPWLQSLLNNACDATTQATCGEISKMLHK